MLVELGPVVFVLRGYNGVLRVVWFRDAQKSLQGQQCGPDCESWGPLVLQNIEANGSSLGGNVGVPNFSVEFHLGGLVGVLWGQLNIDLVEASFIRGIIWPFDVSFPVPEIAPEERDLDVGFFGLSIGRGLLFWRNPRTIF